MRKPFIYVLLAAILLPGTLMAPAVAQQSIHQVQQSDVELARRTGTKLTLLPGVGHYAHLQVPQLTVEEIRATLLP